MNFLLRISFLFSFIFLFLQVVYSATHFSISKNFTPEKNQSGYEVTFFPHETFALRYLSIPNISFGEVYTFQKEGKIFSSYSKDTLEAYQVLQTLDYSNQGPSHKGPFEMITAYYGLGFNELHPNIESTVYSFSGSKVTKSIEKKTTTLIVRTVTFGFYGMEKNVVIDGRVLWLEGTLMDNDLLDGKKEFRSLYLIFSVGVGW